MSEKDRFLPGEGKKLGILGVPLGFGAGTKGSELGVTAMRLSLAQGKQLTEHIQDLGYDLKDFGDVEIVKPDYIASDNENPKYLSEMVESSRRIMDGVRSILEDGRIPLILGGDHSIAIGSFSGISSYFNSQDQEIGLIWFDAHADINTNETSPSGNIHGMPLAALLGRGTESLTHIGDFSPKLNTNYFAHIGARDLDIGEKRLIHDLGLRDNFFTMADVDRRGMNACIKDAIDIASKAPGGFAVTFDVDMIDPRFAPGSGTLVRGGTTYREAHVALETIAESGKLRSLEIVEVNPMLDKSNITVELAIELILSALGKTIL
ncbi:MAG: arginase [Pyrinomonadaceae bacterium]|nr:arginase [Pyrinomonadaceae bacterium]